MDTLTASEKIQHEEGDNKEPEQLKNQIHENSIAEDKLYFTFIRNRNSRNTDILGKIFIETAKLFKKNKYNENCRNF